MRPMICTVFLTFLIASLGTAAPVSYLEQPQATGYFYEFTLTHDGSISGPWYQLLVSLPMDLSLLDPASITAPPGWGDFNGGALYYGEDLILGGTYIAWLADSNTLFDLTEFGVLSGFGFATPAKLSGAIFYDINGLGVFGEAEQTFPEPPPSGVPEPGSFPLMLGVLPLLYRATTRQARRIGKVLVIASLLLLPGVIAQAQYTVSGYVVDPSNIGIADAVVTLQGAVTQSTRTASTGRFEFTNVPGNAAYTLMVTKPGYFFQGVPYTILVKSMNYPLTSNIIGSPGCLNGTCVITVQVKSSTGSALPGVTVTLTSSAAPVTKTTDIQGATSFSVAQGQTYTVAVSSPTYSFSTSSSTITNISQNLTKTFFADATTATLRGTITGTNGGIAGLKVQLAGASTSGKTTTDSSGKFSFAGLQLGLTYTVTPEAAQGYSFAPSSIRQALSSQNAGVWNFSAVGAKADLVVTSITTLATTVAPGEDLTVQYELQNTGKAPTGPFLAVVSLGGVLHNPFPGASATDAWTSLNPGDKPARRTATLKLPISIPAGAYPIVVETKNANDENPADNSRAGLPVAVKPALGYGLTIISHGQRFENPLARTFPLWMLDMADRISLRIGNAKVRAYDKTTGLLKRTSALSCGNHNEPCPDIPDRCLDSACGELIVLFDWYKEAGYPDSGWSEPAADGLFASVMTWQKAGRDISSIHLIGHSRGSVIISELAERLLTTSLLWPEKLSFRDIQMTFLDAHDWGVGSTFAADHDVNPNPNGIVAWNGVTFADSYWEDGDIIHGRAVDGVDADAYLYNISDHGYPHCLYRQSILLADSPDCKIADIKHGGVQNAAFRYSRLGGQERHTPAAQRFQAPFFNTATDAIVPHNISSDKGWIEHGGSGFRPHFADSISLGSRWVKTINPFTNNEERTKELYSVEAKHNRFYVNSNVRKVKFDLFVAPFTQDLPDPGSAADELVVTIYKQSKGVQIEEYSQLPMPITAFRCGDTSLNRLLLTSNIKTNCEFDVVGFGDEVVTLEFKLNSAREPLQGNSYIEISRLHSAGAAGTDLEPPVVSIDGDSYRQTVQTFIQLTGRAVDNVGVTEIVWRNSGGGSGLISAGSPWTSPAIALVPGSNIITITAKDAAGNAGSLSVTVESRPPMSVQVKAQPAGTFVMVNGVYQPTPVATSVPYGSTVDVQADPIQLAGVGQRYVWLNWSDAGARQHSVSAVSPIALTAYFATEFQVTGLATPANGGSVLLSPNNVDGWFGSGQLLTAMAAPNGGYRFDSWTSGLSGTNDTVSFRVDSARSLVASFVPSTGITVTVSPLAATLSAGQSQAFGATVAGAADSRFTWSLAPNVGTVAGNGVYTAPAAIASDQTVAVTATSVADPNRRASALVQLKAVPCAFQVSPDTVSVGRASTNSSFTIKANSPQCSWTASTADTWISIAPASISGQGDATVTFSVTDNTSRLPRMGTVSVGTATCTVRQAGALKPVILLTRPTTDTYVEYFKRLLTANGTAFTTLNAASLTASALDGAIIIAPFAATPTEYAGVPASLVAQAVNSGAWFLADGYGAYILHYAGIGSVSIGTWYPVVQDASFFVKAIDASPLYDGLAAWDPPTLPDKPEQLIGRIIRTGFRQAANYAPPSSGAALYRVWALSATYGYYGQLTNSPYCLAWGGCTPERTVAEGGFRVIQYGLGTIGHFMGVAPAPGDYEYGPIVDKLHVNFIRWAQQ